MRRSLAVMGLVAGCLACSAKEHQTPQQAAHRPVGVAVAPDGALFITDDAHGRIWRVTYKP